MGLSLKKAFRKLDTVARRATPGRAEVKAAVKSAGKDLKRAGSVADDFRKSVFEQVKKDAKGVVAAHRDAHREIASAAKPIVKAAVGQALRDGKLVASATGHAGLDRFLDSFKQTIKTAPPKDQGLDQRFSTLPVAGGTGGTYSVE